MVSRRIILTLLVVLLCHSGFSQKSQSEQVKELMAKIQNTRADTTRVKVLLEAAHYYTRKPGEYTSDLDSASILINRATRLSDSLGAKHWQLQCRYWKGMVHLEKMQWDEARKIMMPVLAEFEALQDKVWQVKTLEAFGGYLSGDPELLNETIDAFAKAINIHKELKNKEDEIKLRMMIEEVHIIQGKVDLAETALMTLLDDCNSFNDKRTYNVLLLLSQINRTLGNPNRALYYGLEALKSMETMGIVGLKSPIFISVAEMYYYLNDNSKALEYLLKGLEESKANYHGLVYYKYSLLVEVMIKEGQVARALEMTKQISKEFIPTENYQKQSIDLSFGHCYFALKQYSLAEKYYESAMKFNVHFIENVFLSYNPVAEFYMTRKLFAKAKPYLMNMLDQPKNTLTASEESQVYYSLYKVDSALGNYFSAMNYISIHKHLSDSIFTITKMRQFQELNLEYETEKKEKDIQLQAQSIDLLTKQAELKDQQIQQGRQLRNGTFAGIVVLAIILGLLYTQYRLKQKTSNQISTKNKILQQLVYEKEWLLKEVHHRVKNNLQTVLSLLESQSRYLNNDALHAIQNSQNRVYAMSLIHKKLYHSSDVASINMEDYLNELVCHLRDSFGPEYGVKFNLNFEPIALDVSQAVPIGLIINEAITNSIKYAFPDKHHDNQITVSMGQLVNKEVELLISDNGKGLDQAHDTRERSGRLGLKLIKGLTEDIEGKLSMKSESGFRILIRFFATIPLHEIRGMTLHQFTAEEL